MKKSILTIAACLAVASAVAQGTVNFQNRIVSVGLDAPVRDADNSLLGAGFYAQLWAGADANSLAAVGSVIQFITNPTTQQGTGYFTGGERTIPGITPGGAAVVQVRAWFGGAGGTVQTWQDALTAGVNYGMSPTLSLSATGNPTSQPPGTPVNLVGLQGFTLVPEPSTYLLLALGAGALLLRRRR